MVNTKALKMVAFFLIFFVVGGTGALSILMGIGGLILGGLAGQIGVALKGSLVYFGYSIVASLIVFFSWRYFINKE